MIYHAKRIKRQDKDLEKTFTNYISDTRLTPRLYEELSKLKSKQSDYKWAEDMNRHCIKEMVKLMVNSK